MKLRYCMSGLILLNILIAGSDLLNKKPSKLPTIHKQKRELLNLNPLFTVSFESDVVDEARNVLDVRSTTHQNSRDVADTLAYIPADGSWNSYFQQWSGDAMMVVYEMPSNGSIEGVNIPVYIWGTGDQELTISLHAVSYPYGTDGNLYDQSFIDGNGWAGGYDMQGNGYVSIEGTNYTPGGTPGICDPGDFVIPNAHDFLGTTDTGTGPPNVPTMGLLWPDSITAVMDPINFPDFSTGGNTSNWLNISDYGSTVEFDAGDWIGILVQYTGNGGGDDDGTGFFYDDAAGVVSPWVFSKFYSECSGTSGNGGWHIRHWMINYQLAILMTGNSAPSFDNISSLPVTISTDDRTVSARIWDTSTGTAGVASAKIFFQLDSLASTLDSVDMVMVSGDAEDGIWEGSIPGQSPETYVEWYLQATDVEGFTSTSTAFAYFIFQPQNDVLIFNNQDWYLQGIYPVSWLYLYWNTNNFDIWESDYGNITSELLGYYNTVIELTGGYSGYGLQVADSVYTNWWGTGKNLIITGDEWLGMRYGYPVDFTIPANDISRTILGIDVYHSDINYVFAGDQNGISRLSTIAGNEVTGELYNFLDSASLFLNYDPVFETGNVNWLDGVTPVTDAHIFLNGYGGIVENADDPDPATTLYPVGIYNQDTINNTFSAFLAYDPIALNTAPDYYWVGASDYYNQNINSALPNNASTLISLIELLGVGMDYVFTLDVSEEEVDQDDTVLVSVSLNALELDSLSFIELFFNDFSDQLVFLGVEVSGTLLGNNNWTVVTNDSAGLTITASTGTDYIDEEGILVYLQLYAPDLTNYNFVQINLNDAVLNDQIFAGRLYDGGVQIISEPTANFNANPRIGSVPLSVVFMDSTISSGEVTQWHWSFGDGDESTSGPFVNHTYTDNGSYSVDLIIVDEYGLTDTVYKEDYIDALIQFGDVNDDGIVNGDDATLILQSVAREVELDSLQSVIADVDLDENISAFDASLILQLEAGIISSLPLIDNSGYEAQGYLHIASATVDAGAAIGIPLAVYDSDNIFSFSGVMEFDNSILELNTVTSTNNLGDFEVLKNPEDNQIYFAGARWDSMAIAGMIFIMYFIVLAEPANDSTVITLSSWQWNNNEVQLDTASGLIEITLGIDNNTLPEVFALHNNYPNPFNPITTIKYDLPEASHVNIQIYDIMGKHVKTILNSKQEPGYKSIIWDSKNSQGNPVSNGMYFYKIRANDFTQTRKMVLLK